MTGFERSLALALERGDAVITAATRASGPSGSLFDDIQQIPYYNVQVRLRGDVLYRDPDFTTPMIQVSSTTSPVTVPAARPGEALELLIRVVKIAVLAWADSLSDFKRTSLLELT